MDSHPQNLVTQVAGLPPITLDLFLWIYNCLTDGEFWLEGTRCGNMPLKYWLNTTRLIKIIGTMLLWHDANPWNILIISRISHHFYQTGSGGQVAECLVCQARSAKSNDSIWRAWPTLCLANQKNAKSLNRLVGGSICHTIYKLTRSCLNLVWHGSTLLASSCFIPSFAEGESKLDGKTIRHKCRLKVVFPNKQQRLIPLSPYHASAKVAARIANDAPKLWPVKTSFQ